MSGAIIKIYFYDSLSLSLSLSLFALPKSSCKTAAAAAANVKLTHFAIFLSQRVGRQCVASQRCVEKSGEGRIA